MTEGLDRPSTSMESCMTWCLPTGTNPYPFWRPLVSEFEATVWLGLLMAFLAATVVLSNLVPSEDLERAAFTALRGLLAGVEPEPTGHAARAFLFCWYFFGLVVGTLYTAALHSISTTDTTETIFHSVRELARTNLPLYILQQQYEGLVVTVRATFLCHRERFQAMHSCFDANILFSSVSPTTWEPTPSLAFKKSFGSVLTNFQVRS